MVRLRVGVGMPSLLLKILLNNLEVDRKNVLRMKGHLALSRLKYIAGIDRPELKDPPFVPAVPHALDPEGEEEDIFSVLRRRDVLLHHPFDSFQPVIDLLDKSAHRSFRARDQDDAVPRGPQLAGG